MSDFIQRLTEFVLKLQNKIIAKLNSMGYYVRYSGGGGRAMAVAWVTGASSGLGYYTALALKQAGWQVAGGARSAEGTSVTASMWLALVTPPSPSA